MKIGYAVEEAAEALGIGRTTMYELMATGDIESVKVGRRRIIPVDSVSAYMERLRAEQKTTAA